MVAIDLNDAFAEWLSEDRHGLPGPLAGTDPDSVMPRP